MSPSSEARRRAGFTLLELCVASGLGVMVLGIIMQAYFGANKAQALAIGSSALKVGAQKSINEIYTALHQNRHLFERGDVTTTFLSRTPISPWLTSGTEMCTPGLPSPDPFVDLQLPVIVDNGTFAKENVLPADLATYEANVGNALFFATIEPQAIVEDTAGTGMVGPMLDSKYYLNALRLHFFYLARRDLPLNAPSVRIGSRYTYHLMHWISEPYLDYGDMVKWMELVMDGTGTTKTTFIDDKLTALTADYAGALDLGVQDASIGVTPSALYDLTATATPDHRDLVANTTARFKTFKFSTAIDFGMKSAYGEPMVAFNTTGTPALPVANLDVPTYANDDATYPYGFEVLVSGRSDARQVLLRLALAARTNPGRNFVGFSYQQVVHIYEYGGAAPTPAPTPTPTPAGDGGG